MGLEYVVLIFLFAFMTGGVMVPVLAWAGYSEVKRRQLKQGLERQGATRVEEVGGPSADAPARLAFWVGEQRVRADAVVRADARLWHISLPVDRASVPARFALVDRRWARPLAPARAMPPQPRSPGVDDGLELRVAEGDEAEGFEATLQKAVAVLGGRPARLKQCVLDSDTLIFEVEREGLSERELLPWVERTLHFADALGVRGTSPPPVLCLGGGEGRIAGSVSGNPVGLPG